MLEYVDDSNPKHKVRKCAYMAASEFFAKITLISGVIKKYRSLKVHRSSDDLLLEAQCN